MITIQSTEFDDLIDALDEAQFIADTDGFRQSIIHNGVRYAVVSSATAKQLKLKTLETVRPRKYSEQGRNKWFETKKRYLERRVNHQVFRPIKGCTSNRNLLN